MEFVSVLMTLFVVFFIVGTVLLVIFSAVGPDKHKAKLQKAQMIDPSIKTIEEANALFDKMEKEKEQKEESSRFVCDYCGNENKKDNEKCSCCGAHIKKK